MGLIAEKYPDDGERGNMMAIALSGLALGVLSEYSSDMFTSAAYTILNIHCSCLLVCCLWNNFIKFSILFYSTTCKCVSHTPFNDVSVNSAMNCALQSMCKLFNHLKTISYMMLTINHIIHDVDHKPYRT